MITRREREEIASKYIIIDEYNIEDIIADEDTDLMKKSIVLYSDYEKRIDEIWNDINNVLKLLKSYDTSAAIDEIEILEAKLY